MGITLTKRVNIAKRMTEETANMKDWQVRNRHNRAMREIARGISDGKGYIIASVRELTQKYGNLCHYDTIATGADAKHVWGLQMNEIYRKIQFVAI